MPLPNRKINLKQLDRGESIIGLLALLFIILVSLNDLFKCELTTFKKVKKIKQDLQSEIMIEECISNILNLTDKKTNIYNLPSVKYHIKENLPEYLIKLTSKNMLNNIKDGSLVIEVLTHELGIFHKQNVNKFISYYATDFPPFKKKLDHFMLLDPWNTYLLKSNLSIKIGQVSGASFSNNPILMAKIDDTGNSNINSLKWLLPISEYSIIYLDNDTIKSHSLIKPDTQPICHGISEFKLKNDTCELTNKLHGQRLNRYFECKNIQPSNAEKLEALEKWS